MKNRILFILSVLFVFYSISFANLDYIVNPVQIDKEILNTSEINIKAGSELSGFVSTDKAMGSDNYDQFSADTGIINFAGEYLIYLSPYTALGLGSSFQMPRSVNGFSGKLSFFPNYITVKVRSWPIEPGMYAYMSGQLGYSFIFDRSDDLEIKRGGLYYGVGIGFVYKSFILEGLFNINKAVLDDRISGKRNINMDYTKFAFMIGYQISGDLFE